MPESGPRASRIMAMHGAVMTRAGAVFGFGLVAIVPFGIISLAVTTRYLSPADFGRLSVFFAIASVVTLFSGLGFMHGTFMATYGMSEEGDGEEIDLDDLEDHAAVRGNEAKRLLGSGVLVVLFESLLICGLVALIGTVAAAELFNNPSWVVPLLWMSASAWTGAIWRMLVQIPRMERRSRQWAFMMWLRPGLVVGLTVPALIYGFGMSGVLAATAIGTAISAVATFLLQRPCFRFAPKRGDVALFWKEGKAWVPLVITVAIQSNANILLLSLITTPASVGVFQVASRIGQLPVYFTDGFITAWPAMERSQVSQAAKDERGRGPYLASTFTLFALLSLGLFAGVSLFSSGLIRIAAPAYAGAASLVPIVAAGYAVWAAFRGVFRATSFLRRRYWYTLMHLIWIGPYAAIVFLLLPWSASYAVAIGQLIAGAFVTYLFVMIDRHENSPTPFQWKRLFIASAAASFAVAFVQLVPGSSATHAIAALVAVIGFPFMLFFTGVLKPSDLRPIRTVLAGLLPQVMWRQSFHLKLSSLPVEEHNAIKRLAGERLTPQDASDIEQVRPEIILARYARGLRDLSYGGSATPFDHLIGEYLTHTGTTLERDTFAASLRSQGIDSLELHILDDTRSRVTRLGVR